MSILFNEDKWLLTIAEPCERVILSGRYIKFLKKEYNMADMGNSELRCHNRRVLLRAGACTGFAITIGAGGLSCCPEGSRPKETKRTDDDFSRVAYCCLECDKCEAYIATQNNDDTLRAKVAKAWKMKSEDIRCEGCKSNNALFNCEAKKCAIARKLPTCAHCPDFPSCDKEIWTKWPKLKEKVKAMRINLQS